jgi:hypothetical protein
MMIKIHFEAREADREPGQIKCSTYPMTTAETEKRISDINIITGEVQITKRADSKTADPTNNAVITTRASSAFAKIVAAM